MRLVCLPFLYVPSPFHPPPRSMVCLRMDSGYVKRCSRGIFLTRDRWRVPISSTPTACLGGSRESGGQDRQPSPKTFQSNGTRVSNRTHYHQPSLVISQPENDQVCRWLNFHIIVAENPFPSSSPCYSCLVPTVCTLLCPAFYVPYASMYRYVIKSIFW